MLKSYIVFIILVVVGFCWEKKKKKLSSLLFRVLSLFMKNMTASSYKSVHFISFIGGEESTPYSEVCGL